LARCFQPLKYNWIHTAQLLLSSSGLVGPRADPPPAEPDMGILFFGPLMLFVADEDAEPVPLDTVDVGVVFIGTAVKLKHII
jgi:hypothetical protein